MSTSPTAAGVRITWSGLPAAVQAAVEGALGSPVVEARSQIGGFSPGTADRVVLADGRRAFVKSVSAGLNDVSVQMHRDEARYLAALPEHAPAPRLLGALETDGWITLLIDDVDGHQPELPWRSADVVRVADALRELHEAGPVAPAAVDRHFAETHDDLFDAWAVVAERSPDDLHPWCTERLDALVAREVVAPEHVSGEALLHCDVRSDNVLIRPDGSVVLVDWAWCCRGAPWLDPALLLLSVVVQEAEDPQSIERLLGDPLLADAPREHVESALLSFLGMFERRSREAPPPGLPTLRPWQKHCADALRGWLAQHVRTL
jgi:serine/threonine protein kinase